MSRLTGIAGIVLAALMLSQCGGPSAGPPARAAVTHRVTIDGSTFTPASLTVHAGDSVVWINADPFPHTATSMDRSAAGHFDSKEIAPQQSWSYTPTVKGDFPYLCTLHQTMKGTLRVE